MQSSYDSMNSSVIGKGIAGLQKVAGKNNVANAIAHTPAVGLQELPDPGRRPTQKRSAEFEALGGAHFENSQMV